MKTRILFVDDEPLVLQGLQRMLRSMRNEWDLDFAEGGAAAQARLAEKEYDLVITDMLMPGMNGAELLEYVKAKAPKTLRIVLSGHAEQELALKCVGIAHQYLSKPCDPETLKATVARVTVPDFAARNEQVMKLVVQMENLPSIPAVYAEIVRVLRDPDVSMDAIGELIARDLGMTAKILKIVNSSFFGLAQRVSKPVDAASYLGLDTLKALVLAANVFSEFSGGAAGGQQAVCAANHGQLVGAAARAIAKAERAPRALIDEALVAGLLHDVGKLVLAANLPEQSARAAALPELGELEAERQIFGTTHAEVGGYLLGLWGLPTSIVEAITLHHSPSASATDKFSPLTAVHVANHLIAENACVSGGTIDAHLDLEYLSALGLADRLPDWREAVQSLAEASLA